MGVWMGGWMDRSKCGAGAGGAGTGGSGWQSRLKKWQLPCKSAWPLLVYVALSLMLAHAVVGAAVEVAFLFTPFLIGMQHSRLQDAFLWGQLQGGGHNPCQFSPLACGLGMHEMAYPSQDSISPSTLDRLTACLLQCYQRSLSSPDDPR